MSKLILNLNNCTFSCPNLTGTIIINSSEKSFNDGNGNALTKNTKLSCLGTCSILPPTPAGTPSPCPQVSIGNWSSGVESKMKINGVALLNQDAKITCPNGGSIKATPKSMVATASVSVSTASVSTPSGKTKVTSSAVATSNKPVDTPQATNSTNFTKTDTTQHHIETLDNPSEQDTTPQEVVEKDKYINAICAYETCGKAKDCPYILASSTINTNGLAMKLRNNSSEKESEYVNYSSALMQENEISWGNQAHHMISAKAAYCQYPMLVKLGNYFGYDINCSQNCYFLPAWEKDDGYGEKTSHYKKAQAYEVMNVSKLQWHVGQHNYRIDLPSSVLVKYPLLRSLSCYNDIINADVKKVLQKCEHRFGNDCLKTQYDLNKKWFLNLMNSLSESVEEKLDKFKSNPKSSFPYYVSAETLRYSFELPRSGKAILVTNTDGEWLLSKYKYSRVDNQSNRIQTYLIDKAHYTDVYSCIVFCENVQCFLVVDDSKSFAMPFSSNVNLRYISTDDMEKLNIHFEALITSAVDDGENNYTFPKAMINKRLKECGLK
jgi:transposase-like protein